MNAAATDNHGNHGRDESDLRPNSQSEPEHHVAVGPAGAASPMVQFKAMLDLRMSIFWGNMLLVVPLVLYPVIYLIIFFASDASSYPPAPHIIPPYWDFRWFMPRIPSYVGGGSTSDPAASNAMIAAVNASVQAIRVSNEGKDSVDMIPSLWHRANTLDELKELLANLTGSNPLRDEFRPDATPPVGGFMLHSIPTAQQPSQRFNVSIVVDPTPYKWAWGVPVAMLNSVHSGVQDVLPPLRNRNVSADAKVAMSDTKSAALDRVFALYQNATAAGRKVIPPWSMDLAGEQHAYRLTGTERADYISPITVPLLLFSVYVWNPASLVSAHVGAVFLPCDQLSHALHLLLFGHGWVPANHLLRHGLYCLVVHAVALDLAIADHCHDDFVLLHRRDRSRSVFVCIQVEKLCSRCFVLVYSDRVRWSDAVACVRVCAFIHRRLDPLMHPPVICHHRHL
ncbi:hypothetical protein BCR44DRAFT_167353 [Catenaria anguillulae PL171]|uniref:Transmembrane protein n=1 Tax=Catenaria anguillulae PL171 TaxID=765915 RepID=A0A1Y2HAK0_9FUNG|nr:hypothetical protein BCR44DRAFT_167353 [Catenaria anguillulae PL171]